jgi:hypothetical protein
VYHGYTRNFAFIKHRPKTQGSERKTILCAELKGVKDGGEYYHKTALNLVKIKKRFLTKAMFLVSPKHIFNFK